MNKKYVSDGSLNKYGEKFTDCLFNYSDPKIVEGTDQRYAICMIFDSILKECIKESILKYDEMICAEEVFAQHSTDALKGREKALKYFGVEKCLHKPDGNAYTSNPPQYKCKKCGEFYR